MPVWNSSGSSSRTRNWEKPRLMSGTNVVMRKTFSATSSTELFIVKTPRFGYRGGAYC